MQLHAKQMEAQQVLAGDAVHIMLFGGSRSGKTFLLVRNVIYRALKAPKSRHAILRFRFNAVKSSVVMDTFPKVMQLAFPGVSYKVNKTDWFAEFDNGSQIWFAGLDDKERTEKILGMEFATIYLNECSQIPWGSVGIATTRLAQKATQVIENRADRPLKPRMYYDCVSGDTVLPGQTKTVEQLAADGVAIKALTTHGWRTASAPWKNGYGMLYEVKTESGRRLKVTASHRFWTPKGWQRLDQITIGQSILCTAEHSSRHDGQDAHEQKQTPQDSPENCYKCRHQCDEQSRPAEVSGLACPASSFCEATHNPSCLHRGKQGSHTGRQDQPEAQHSHHNQSFHKQLYPEFAGCFLSMEYSDDLPASESFPEKLRFYQKSLLAECRRITSEQSQLAYQRSCASLCDSQVTEDFAAIGIQSQRYNLSRRQSLCRLDLLSIEPSVDLDSFDTPLFDMCWYESVAGISETTADSYYTLEVPFVNHYVANGMVSHNCNPPSKAHWSYRVFIEKRDPDTKIGHPKPGDYAAFQINPHDNKENLSAGYLETLEGLSARLRRRFLEGSFADSTPNALFPEENIDRWRVVDGVVPDMVRIIVGVDPSGSGDDDNADNDAIGIVVGGLGTDGNAYLIEDTTVKAGPATWGKLATSAYERHAADVIVGETNYGGAMVNHVIQTARPRTPYKTVTATRGKVVRAEPFAALYEQGKIRHIGMFPDLEDELVAFTTNGYSLGGSPNRADAWVWVLTELFPGIVKEKKEPAKAISAYRGNAGGSGWMGG